MLARRYSFEYRPVSNNRVNRTRAKPMYNCTLIQIDAIKDEFGGWNWNDLFKLESGIMLSEDSELLTSSRKLLKYFRDKLQVLNDYSKGRVSIDWNGDIMDGVLITICDKNTGEPIFALSSIH